MQRDSVSTKGQRLVSLRVLTQLEEQIGAEAISRALDLLRVDLGSAAETLASCLDSRDEARARRTGHKLKGILEQYGVRDTDRTAENLASRHDLFWVPECTALVSLCKGAVDEILDIQAARTAGHDEAHQEALRAAIRPQIAVTPSSKSFRCDEVRRSAPSSDPEP